MSFGGPVFTRRSTVQGINPGPPSPVLWGSKIFVDPELGDDATGQRNDLVFKFETYDAALAVALPFDEIIVLNSTVTPAAGLWGNIDNLTVTLYPSVTLSGTNLNSDIGDNCAIRGFGTVIDDGIFIQAVDGKTMYFEAYEFFLSRIQCEGVGKLTMRAWTNITIDQYVQFYNNPYVVFWYADKTIFTNDGGGGGLSAFSMITQPDSLVHIHSDLYAEGVFTKILDFSGLLGDWTVDFKMPKGYTIYVNAIPTEAVVRSYNNYNYNTSLTNKKYNLRLDADIICNVAAYRAIWCFAGFLEYTGRLYSSSSAAGAIEINADALGINQPATILLSKGCEINADSTGGVWTADGVIKCIGSANNAVIIDDLKLICADNTMLAIQSNVAGTELRLQGVARSNMALGGNMTNTIASTTWTQETNITF